VKSDQAIEARIPVLLNRQSPSAIARRIRAGIVDAVQAVLLRRTRTHIRVEGFERRPRLADGNATCAIVLVGMMLGIQATVAHVGPGPIFRSAASIAGVSVSCVQLSYFAANRSAVATARSGVTRSEVSGCDGSSSAAVASANPLRISELCTDRRERLNYQPSKALTGQVHHVCHGVDHITRGRIVAQHTGAG